MARARQGFSSQPEQTVMQSRVARRFDYTRMQGTHIQVYGSGEWYGRLFCGHGILRHRKPKVGQVVVCWACAQKVHVTVEVTHARS